MRDGCRAIFPSTPDPGPSVLHMSKWGEPRSVHPGRLEKEREDIMDANRQKTEEPSTPVAADQSPASTKALPRKQLYAIGKELRNACPRVSHARWKPARNRPDAVGMVLAAEKGR